MSEYIKREDVLDFLSGIYDCNDMVFKDDVCGRGADCSTCRWRDTRDFIREKISRFPAADVVEVVRCKDCIHSTPWYGVKSRCFLWHEEGIDVWNDGYCNYGEKTEKGGKNEL